MPWWHARPDIREAVEPVWKDAGLQKWTERGSKAGLRGWPRLFPLGNGP
jgi:hypothetical protein